MAKMVALQLSECHFNPCLVLRFGVPERESAPAHPIYIFGSIQRGHRPFATVRSSILLVSAKIHPVSAHFTRNSSHLFLFWMSIWGMITCFLRWITYGERIFQNVQILWSKWTAYKYGRTAPTFLYRDYPGVTVKLSAYNLFLRWIIHLQFKFW